jgi:hypothetical protein
MNLEQHTRETERQAHRLRNGILSAAALLVLLLSVVLAVPELRGLLGQVTDASAGWLLLAVLLEFASRLGYVAMVRLGCPTARRGRSGGSRGPKWRSECSYPWAARV